MKKDKGEGAVRTRDMSNPPSPYIHSTAHFTLHIDACMPSVTLQRREAYVPENLDCLVLPKSLTNYSPL